MLKYFLIILFILSGKVFAQNSPLDTTCLNNITPVITVANNDSLLCEGELTVFTTQASYGNAIPSYQWLVNGRPVGTNSSTYSTNTLTNGSRVECVLTISKPSCPGVTKSATSQMTIYVYPMVHPAITITPSRTQICRGEEVTFTATANGGAFPTFVWEVNGIPTGDVGPGLVTNTLKDGDTVSCIITIDVSSKCHTNTISASSNKVVIYVRDYKDPTVMIAAPVLDICPGMAVTFTATAQNAGDYSLYNWQVNDHYTGNSSSIFTYDKFANGDKVFCTLSTNIPGCYIPVSVPSNFEIVKVKPVPLVTFTPAEISVMSGESAQLNATVSVNPVSFIWTPSGALVSPQSLISATVPLLHDTTFNLSVVDTNGCTAGKDIVVKVLHKFYMPSSFTPNQDGKNDVFRIPPGSSITLKEFSIFNRWGQPVFYTTDITKGWNGKYKGMNSDSDIYVYVIKGVVNGKDEIIKGTVTLLK